MWKLFHGLRMLVSSHMVKEKERAKLGCHGMTVEVNEFMINHSTYHLRGTHQQQNRAINQTDCQVWVVGLVERNLAGETCQSAVYLVPDRTQKTVEALLAKHLRPHTVVHTDGGACY